MSDGSIDLWEGAADPLKGPTDVGTGRAKEEEVTLSRLIERLNERFGTDFTKADQLFFDQIRASAENNENIAERLAPIASRISLLIWVACWMIYSSRAWKAMRRSSPG